MTESLGMWGQSPEIASDPMSVGYNIKGDEVGRSGFIGVDQSQSQDQYRQAQAARQQQQSALALMQQQASGQGPSAAQSQFNQNLNQAMLAQAGGANSARGGGVGLAAARAQGAQQQAAMAGQGANQAAQLRAQEMQQAQQGYLAGAQGMRGQDLSAQNAAFQQQLSLSQYGQNATNQNMQNDIAWNQLSNQRDIAQLSADTSAYNSDTAQRTGMINNVVGGLMNMGGSMMGMMSDEDAKENIQSATSSAYNTATSVSDSEVNDMMRSMSSAPPDSSGGAKHAVGSDRRMKQNVEDRPNAVDSFLAQLHPKTYDYREQEDAPGPGRRGYLGVLAQDVERAPGGEELVTETPRGMALNPGTMSAALAGLGRLHERVAALEGEAQGLRSYHGGNRGG